MKMNVKVKPQSSSIFAYGYCLFFYFLVLFDISNAQTATTDPSEVFKSYNQARIGVIIWDWRGKAIGALSMPVLATQFVVELEALACHHGVQFAMELGLQEVVFEGDSLQVIQVVSQEHSDHLTYGHIIEDIRNQVVALSSYNFIFNTRHYNVVANALAKKAKNFRETRVRIDSLPEDIVPLVEFGIH